MENMNVHDIEGKRYFHNGTCEIFDNYIVLIMKKITLSIYRKSYLNTHLNLGVICILCRDLGQCKNIIH